MQIIRERLPYELMNFLEIYGYILRAFGMLSHLAPEDRLRRLRAQLSDPLGKCQRNI
jgi:hypothetical protein